VNIAAPVLIITFMTSILIFFLNDSIVPVTNRRAENIKRKIEKRPKEMFFKEDSLWFKYDSYTLYNVRFVDPDKKMLWRINIYYLSPDFQIRESITAEKAVSENGRWFLQSGVRRAFDIHNSGHNSELTIHRFERLPIVLPFDLKDVGHAVVQASETRFSVLRNYIAKIRREGYEVKRLAVDLYAKTSFPLAGFIMTVIGISLAMHMKDSAPGLWNRPVHNNESTLLGLLLYVTPSGLFRLHPPFLSPGRQI